MANILNFSKYTWKEWLTFVIAIISLIFAVISIFIFAHFAVKSRDEFFSAIYPTLIIISWVCGPPAWFYFEYFLLWPDSEDDKKERLKIGRELAKPFWAAVLLVLLFLVPK